MLLPYLLNLLKKLSDPNDSSLTILARGLGLRKLICALLKTFNIPNTLIFLVNATPEEENGIRESLSMIGCRPTLKMVGFEIPRKERQILYNNGGIVSVTSRILVVDLLQSDIPVDKITGLIVMHAERVTALDATAFITRLFRERNPKGFLKAFSDQPEQITSGLFPLRNVLKELQIRTVHLYPRFHEEIQSSLLKRKADVIELAQEMTTSMRDIHEGIIACMTTTLSELKRSNTSLDLDDLDIKAVYFRSFDATVRHQLDPVWNKVGPRTKRLVADLSVLRKLLSYLVSYDPLDFYAYLETIIASNAPSSDFLNGQSESPPWLMTDAAHTIISAAKRRCYVENLKSSGHQDSNESPNGAEWEILDELEGISTQPQDSRPSWLPKTIEPVLEEPPKWALLSDILFEIEQEMNDSPGLLSQPGTNNVVIMTSSNRTCTMLRDYLNSSDPSDSKSSRGRQMLMEKFHGYINWKAYRHTAEKQSKTYSIAKNDITPVPGINQTVLGEALLKKDKDRIERSAKRRRIRGGAPVDGSRGRSLAQEVELFSGSLQYIKIGNQDSGQQRAEQTAFDAHFALLVPDQTVIIRSYSDDTDDEILADLKPRFIILYEPNQDFIRRIEVFRNSNPGLAVRVYFMFYTMSCEEHKYLYGLRREKDSFERLIKERGSMLMPIIDERRTGDSHIRALSTRIAGGSKMATTEVSQVVVDMREFRSSLPNLLHATNTKIIPATLIIGDYILTPDMCVERKSIPDLISSFNTGRLYTQCELMSLHYKQPILLIEFEENKAFSLEAVRSFKKENGKYPLKKQINEPNPESSSFISVQSKLVLLTLSFPRLRIIWSSSPHATAEIFKDLKLRNPEPDPSRAIAMGAEGGTPIINGWNTGAEELLRSFPSISEKNVRYVMGKASNIQELCAMKIEQIQEILGVVPGTAFWDFIHHGE
ncbi:hypothetical protein Clacol_007332 [Clathrus columnatus]|uniref:ERCC4 domain-containing protein n=1 Tax=Clathrus columnatus TaxID=1419009 RepID=A0AAV5AEN4_9AGAM|nr:hypothetical protein Clacol_007332 [Clathrus columnatus]